MIVIFSASGDRASYQHSSRIIGPLVHWLFPSLTPEQVHTAVMVGRKCAHLTEYAVLAWLLWLAQRARRRPPAGEWDWKLVGRTLLLVALYAASDEVHQAFVPYRQASILDVFIDTSGALAGLLFLYGLSQARKAWGRRKGGDGVMAVAGSRSPQREAK